MIKFWITARAAALACFGVWASCAAAASANWQEHRTTVGGKERIYQVYRPLSAKTGAPAVLVLHGGSQSMRKIFGDKGGANLAWLDVADREGVVLIAPNGTHRRTGDALGEQQTWNDFRDQKGMGGIDDVAFLRQVVAEQTQALRLDAKRIHITGASNGGMMTYRMLIEAPELFASGAAFIANLPQNLQTLPKPARPAPIMIVNGTQDPMVKWEGGTVAGDDDRGTTASTADTVAWWVAANRAGPARASLPLPDLNPADGCKISLQAHPGTGPGTEPVWLYTATGGGHAMPSIKYDIPDSRLVRRMIGTACKDAEGAELAWRFMSKQR